MWIIQAESKQYYYLLNYGDIFQVFFRIASAALNETNVHAQNIQHIRTDIIELDEAIID